MAAMSYVPALDGVRALAVTAVLCFHGGVPGAGGGFLGVDAFFVLSGYLITTLLLAEWQRTHRIDVAAFWGRRARRLLPALVVMVAVVVLAAPALSPMVHDTSWEMNRRSSNSKKRRPQNRRLRSPGNVQRRIG